jgi:hypothetical protein
LKSQGKPWKKVRILLDECLPRQLVTELIGHTVDTVQKSGWAGLKNGKLLEKVSGKYEIFLTIDKRIGHEQKIPGDVAVVTVRARSNRIQDLKPLVPEILQAVKQAKSGKTISVVRTTRR